MKRTFLLAHLQKEKSSMKKKEVVPEDSSSKGGIQVIARAVAVLQKLREHPDGLSLGELAKLLKLPRSTVQRIVAALDDENLVISASPTRGVRLGPALLSLAAATRFEISEIARPTLQEISLQSGETVDLSLLDGNKLVFVDQIVGGHRLKAESGIGVSFSLHSTAPGKAMISAMTDAELLTLRPKMSLERVTPNTITTWDALSKEISSVRQRGIADDVEENSIGICAISMALRLPGGEIAAISVPVPTQRFEIMRPTLEKLLLTHGGKLQASIRR
jgi:IclR family transcriptional regulator, acetate operon repressor